MKSNTPTRKPYSAPQLIEYGNLGQLIRANNQGAVADGKTGGKTKVFKSG